MNTKFALIFDWKELTMGIKEVFYFQNPFTVPYFVVNYLSIYLYEAIVPSDFLFKFFGLKRIFVIEFLPNR